MTSFWNSEACGQTVLPVRQILLENASLWLENSNDIKCWSVCQTPFLMILKKLFGKVQISNFPSFWTCFSCPIEHFRCSNFKLFPLICLSATGDLDRERRLGQPRFGFRLHLRCEKMKENCSRANRQMGIREEKSIESEGRT